MLMSQFISFLEFNAVNKQGEPNVLVNAPVLPIFTNGNLNDGSITYPTVKKALRLTMLPLPYIEIPLLLKYYQHMLDHVYYQERIGGLNPLNTRVILDTEIFKHDTDEVNLIKDIYSSVVTMSAADLKSHLMTKSKAKAVFESILNYQEYFNSAYVNQSTYSFPDLTREIVGIPIIVPKEYFSLLDEKAKESYARELFHFTNQLADFS